MKEEWRAVVGYEGYYEVSNKGDVRSLDRMVSNGKVEYFKQGRVLKKSKTSTGYWKVELQVNGVVKSFKVHRLVAFAFIPIIKGKELINHRNGKPLDNVVSNLEWCTQSENMYHSYENQLTPSNFHKHKDEIIERYKNGELNMKEASEKYDCNEFTIKKYLVKSGIRIRTSSEERDIYKIDRVQLVEDFKSGMKNVDIAKKHNTNRGLIGVYKNKHKKGELL